MKLNRGIIHILAMTLVVLLVLIPAAENYIMTLRTEATNAKTEALQSQKEAHDKQLALQNMSRVIQTQSKLLSSRSAGVTDFNPGPWMPFVATWYDGEGGINGGSVTALGKLVRPDWTIAVDPSVIPLRSLVEIRFSDGTSRVYEATDTGGAIKGNRIDIFEPNAQTCMRNGRKAVEVRVLVRGN